MGSNPIQLVAVGAMGLCAALGLFLLLRGQPKWAMALWTATLFFTPVWLGVNGPGLFVTALTAMTVLCIATGWGEGLRWSLVDTVVLVLLVVVLLAQVFGGSIVGHVQQTLITWFLPYAWGRMVLSRVSENWVSACISLAALIASALAIVEFVTGQNFFLLVPGEPGVWGELQIRGGQLRVEGAFGHSIALGGTLAMSAAFIVSVRWPAWVRLSTLAVVGVATALTFSRLGIIGFAMTIVIAVIYLGAYIRKSFRITMLAVLAVGAALAVPQLLQVFGEAGSEAEGSADYRFDLIPLLNSIVVLGVSPAREVLPTGEDYWGGFRSIDSALVLTGLRFGLICLVVIVLLLVILVVSVLRNRANPASVALVAQIPAFATVALITQYAIFVWFAAGLAVASYTLRRTSGETGGLLEERVHKTRDVVGAT